MGRCKALNRALLTVTDAQTIYVMHANIYYVSWRAVIPEEVRGGRKNAEETNTSCSCLGIYLLICFCLENNSGGYPNVSNVYVPPFCQWILQKREKSILYFFLLARLFRKCVHKHKIKKMAAVCSTTFQTCGKYVSFSRKLNWAIF